MNLRINLWMSDGKIDVGISIKTILIVRLIRYIICFKLISWDNP